jgi:hypothetical protein
MRERSLSLPCSPTLRGNNFGLMCRRLRSPLRTGSVGRALQTLPQPNSVTINVKPDSTISDLDLNLVRFYSLIADGTGSSVAVSGKNRIRPSRG